MSKEIESGILQDTLVHIPQDENAAVDTSFEFNIGYSGGETTRTREDSFEIQFGNNNGGGDANEFYSKFLTPTSNRSVDDGDSNGLPMDLSSMSKESKLKKLTKHAHIVGKNLEHMSWELKEYLNDVTNKSVMNFDEVDSDLEGLESIVSVSIKDNKRLLEKNATLRQKLLTAKDLYEQIKKIKEAVNDMHKLTLEHF
eukprot:g6417.t1